MSRPRSPAAALRAPARTGASTARGSAARGNQPRANETPEDETRAPEHEPRALEDAAASLGLSLNAGQRARLLAYCALLRRWNAVYNLTAIRDPEAMLVQHLFDCLAIVPALRAAPLAPPHDAARATPDSAVALHGADPALQGSATVLNGAAPVPASDEATEDLMRDGAVVLDVGSGGGLPGVVLAICAPGVRVYCVDTVGKKAAFITQVRAELGLDNLHALHARVESLRAPRDLPPATLIVSRAFSSLAQFVGLTGHLRAPGGVWAAMKGQLPADELQALGASVRLRAAITLAVPRLDAQRHLLLLSD